MQPPRLPFQPPLQSRAARAGARQQVDADGDALAPLRSQRCHRRRERLQGIGVEVQTGQRLDAGAGQGQLGAEPHRLAGRLLARRRHVGDLLQLRSLVVAQRGAQQSARAVGDFEQVDEAALAIVGQLHPQRLGSAVEPAAQAAIGSRQLGGEAQHGLRLGVELIGRDHRDRGARGQRAARGEEALWSQREGDSDGAESEGRERCRVGEEVIDADARYGAPEGGDHEHRKERQHRPGIATVALHALTSG